MCTYSFYKCSTIPTVTISFVKLYIVMRFVLTTVFVAYIGNIRLPYFNILLLATDCISIIIF